MNTSFVVYNSSGRILRRGLVPPDSVSIQAREGEFVLHAPEGTDPRTEYIDLSGPVPLIVPRPLSSVELSQSDLTVTLSNVKLGALVSVFGDADLRLTQDEEDGTIELEFELPGTYTIRCEQFPELPFEQTVTL